MYLNEHKGIWDPDFIGYLLEWLGYDGVAFFQMCADEYDSTAPVWVTTADGGSPDRPRALQLPHPVHFREGMQVRNAMREIHRRMGVGLYTAHFYDDHWQAAVLAALKMCEEGFTDEYRTAKG